MPAENHDAYKPAEIAALIETAGVAKAALPLHRMATLAMLAGAPAMAQGFDWSTLSQLAPTRAQAPYRAHGDTPPLRLVG